MQVVTLITTPTERNSDGALLKSLRNAWGGGDVRRKEREYLAHHIAADFRGFHQHIMLGVADHRKLTIRPLFHPALDRSVIYELIQLTANCDARRIW